MVPTFEIRIIESRALIDWVARERWSRNVDGIAQLNVPLIVNGMARA
jgi:hypothetical protein